MTASPDAERTPFQVARDHAEETGTWPENWGPYHRHFASDAIHRDGGPECDQPGTPRRVYVFDDDTLDMHEAAVARWAVARVTGQDPAPRCPNDPAHPLSAVTLLCLTCRIPPQDSR